MLYKPNLEETIRRHRAFWNKRMQDRILCRINVREGDAGAGTETFMNNIPEIVKLKDLAGIQLSDDPGCPKAFEKLSWLKEITGDIPLNITCTLEEFMDGLEHHTLAGNVMYDINGEGYKPVSITVDEANALMEKVKRYQV